MLKINLHHRPANMVKVAAWLRDQADYLVLHQDELSNKFLARFFVDDEFIVRHPVEIPSKGYRVDGSAVGNG
jgi:hypothetical protein